MNPYQIFLRKALSLALTLSVNLATVTCKAAPPAEQAAQPAAAPAAAPPVPNSPEYYEDLLKPIALYPDVLVAQILTAAVNSQEVLDAGNWLLQNTNLKENERQEAAKKAGFGPSIQALVLFPEVVDMMCQNLDWTKQVGEAFKADQKGMLAAAQKLRQEALKSGALQTNAQQTVTTKTENGTTVVVIQPTNPQVIYVPQYNPQVVYAAPPAQPATTTTTTTQSSDTGEKVAIGLLSFGVGMALGAALNNNNYYGYPNWGYGGVYYGPRIYAPIYIYRPVYPGYRPATGYPRPTQYPYYGRYGNNTNVNVNVNNNYFNQYKNNANISRYPANNQQRPTTLPANTQGNQNWRGQSTYAGAKGAGAGATTQDLSRNRAAAGTTGANRATTQPQVQNPGAATTASNAGVNRGTQTQARTSSQPNTMGDSTSGKSAAARSADRGYSASPSRESSQSGRSSAFSGAGHASSERAASQRGRTSAGQASSGGVRRR